MPPLMQTLAVAIAFMVVVAVAVIRGVAGVSTTLILISVSVTPLDVVSSMLWVDSLLFEKSTSSSLSQQATNFVSLFLILSPSCSHVFFCVPLWSHLDCSPGLSFKLSRLWPTTAMQWHSNYFVKLYQNRRPTFVAIFVFIIDSVGHLVVQSLVAWSELASASNWIAQKLKIGVGRSK